MPNHVHVLVETVGGWEVAKIVWSWKSWTGGQIAKIILSGSGASKVQQEALKSLQGDQDTRQRKQFPIWHREYWDRFIRDERHFAAAVAYIENNPAKAGLAPTADSWPWGSAGYRISRPQEFVGDHGQAGENATPEGGGPGGMSSLTQMLSDIDSDFFEEE